MQQVLSWIGWISMASCFVLMLNAAYIGLVVKGDFNGLKGQEKARADLRFIVVTVLLAMLFAYPTFFKAPFSWSIFQ